MEGSAKANNEYHGEVVDVGDERIVLIINFNGEMHRLYANLDVPLSKFFRDFYNGLDLIHGSVRFSLDGKRLSEEDTPRELEMVAGDMIDGFQEQLGG